MKDPWRKRISRREFVKRAAAVGAAVMLPRVAGAFEKPVKPLRVIFSLGTHGTLADAGVVESLLKRHSPHFYAPEVVARPLSDAETLAKKGLGALGRRVSVESRDFALGEERVLARRKPGLVLLEGFDKRGLDKVRGIISRARKAEENAEELFSRGNWEDALESFRAGLKLKAVMVKARDERITRSISEFAPRARGKTLLVRLGASHTLPYIKLKGTPGVAVERVFDSSPYFYSHSSEAIRRFVHGKRVSKDLLAKALAEHVVGKERFFKKARGALANAGQRVLFKDFGLSDLVVASHEAGGSLSGASRAVVRMVESKGLAFPGNKAGLERFVKKHYPQFRLAE